MKLPGSKPFYEAKKEIDLANRNRGHVSDNPARTRAKERSDARPFKAVDPDESRDKYGYYRNKITGRFACVPTAVSYIAPERKKK